MNMSAPSAKIPKYPPWRPTEHQPVEELLGRGGELGRSPDTRTTILGACSGSLAPSDSRNHCTDAVNQNPEYGGCNLRPNVAAGSPRPDELMDHL